MKKVKSIYAGLIAAVLLASVTTVVFAGHIVTTSGEYSSYGDDWLDYFFSCLIFGHC
ncbi:MAG: hypothetical protein ACNYPI_00035 [Arenicellales bacterium WSBS_2016_MAG_OTU3]